MRLRRLNLNSFWTLQAQEVLFGDGLTLVTGTNGAGKTAMAVDGLAWLLWGQTIRGTSSAGDVGGELDGPDGRTYRIERSRKTKKAPVLVTLFREGDGGHWDNLTGQTPTETQERIDGVFGSWERHVATRVFSVRLAARFGSATDKERKALLEAILGLERFERGADKAREMVRDRRIELGQADQSKAAAEAEVQQVQRLIGRLPPEEYTLADVDDAEKMAREASDGAARALADAEKVAKKAADSAEMATRILTQQVTAGRNVAAEIEQIDRTVRDAAARSEKAKAMGTCPVCYRPTDAASVALADTVAQDVAKEVAPRRAELAEQLRAAQLEAISAQEDNAALVKARDVAATKLPDLRTRATRLQEDAAQAARTASATRARAAEAGRLQDELGAARGRQQEAQEAAQRAALSVAEVMAAVEVLGSRGARTRMLDSSLAEVGVHANDVMRRLGSDVRLELSGTRKQASGREVDEVSIVIEGAGGGEYAGVSDGEKARVDLGILLGLAAVAGERSGLIAFDEVFDPLDDAGLEGVSELIEEMARERQVFVITHSPRFTGIVTADRRFQVVPGPDGSQVVPV